MSQPQTVHAITLAPNVGKLREIKTAFGVCAAYDPSTTPPEQRPALQSFDAIWDTGATNCSISQRVVDACGLKPFTMVTVSGAHGPKVCPAFLINVVIYQGPTVYNVQATLNELPDGTDALIGMDIITFGDFSITNKDGQTVFSFRIPSQERVDFCDPKHHESRPKPPQKFSVGGASQHGKKRRKR